MQKVNCRNNHKTDRMVEFQILKGCSSTSTFRFGTLKCSSFFLFYFPVFLSKYYIHVIDVKSVHCSYFCTAWILLCPTETRPPEPIELSLFLTPPQFFRSNSRICLTVEAFFGLFSDRQQSSCTEHIEKGRKSNARMIEMEGVSFQIKTCSAGSGWCFPAALVPFNCVNDDD